MSQLNLYKIDQTKHQEFINEISGKYDIIGDERRIVMEFDDKEVEFNLTLYVDVPDGENPIEWNWLMNYFGNDGITTRSNPKGVLVIITGEDIFACSYGYSYFVVDKYCDTDFAFKFARRIRYREIKTTTLLSPNSKRNRTINTYIDYGNIEFDSGESFEKLKVVALLPEDFKLFGQNIELGNSIKFMIENDNIETILSIIIYVNNVILNSKEIYKIPVFTKMVEDEKIEELKRRLSDSVEANQLSVNLSELDIVGVSEIFLRNFSSYELIYKRSREILDELSRESVVRFATENRMTLSEALWKVKVVSKNNNIPIDRKVLYELIEYTDDEFRCVMRKGKWYKFNDDYLGYLCDSIGELDVIYNNKYDFTKKMHEEFVNSRFKLEMHNEEYIGLSKEQIFNKIERKYYRERAYNMIMCEKFGFTCYDRVGSSVGGEIVELMDLYKDEVIYAVKIGNTSSTLCYAVDQSTTALKLYKHRGLENMPTAKRFAVWLLLDRKNRLNLVNGRPDINELAMMSLKNKLDAWKKEVRILGYAPVVMINYFN